MGLTANTRNQPADLQLPTLSCAMCAVFCCWNQNQVRKLALLDIVSNFMQFPPGCDLFGNVSMLLPVPGFDVLIDKELRRGDPTSSSRQMVHSDSGSRLEKAKTMTQGHVSIDHWVVS